MGKLFISFLFLLSCLRAKEKQKEHKILAFQFHSISSSTSNCPNLTDCRYVIVCALAIMYPNGQLTIIFLALNTCIVIMNDEELYKFLTHKSKVK